MFGEMNVMSRFSEDPKKKRDAGFMQGRYGSDRLGTVLVITSLILSIAANWVGAWMTVVALLLLVVAVLRLLSRNIEARRKENRAFLQIVTFPSRTLQRHHIKFSHRKTRAYVRCPHCHTEFSLPKGKGRVSATCPKCGECSKYRV